MRFAFAISDFNPRRAGLFQPFHALEGAWKSEFKLAAPAGKRSPQNHDHHERGITRKKHEKHNLLFTGVQVRPTR